MLVGLRSRRTWSRSTVAFADTRPGPRIATRGSTTPDGSPPAISYWRYAFTSFSVIGVRIADRRVAVPMRPWIEVILRFITSASRRSTAPSCAAASVTPIANTLPRLNLPAAIKALPANPGERPAV
jgi:hypothetical protein